MNAFLNYIPTKASFGEILVSTGDIPEEALRSMKEIFFTAYIDITESECKNPVNGSRRVGKVVDFFGNGNSFQEETLYEALEKLRPYTRGGFLAFESAVEVGPRNWAYAFDVVSRTWKKYIQVGNSFVVVSDEPIGGKGSLLEAFSVEAKAQFTKYSEKMARFREKESI